MIKKSYAILSLRPNAIFSMRGDELEWLDTEQTRPTDAEITAEITRLEADYAAKQYQRDRAAAYPSFADQFDLLYHGGYDAWKAAIDAIKQEYPKP
jgi:uncharacterized small protein (DUF1192 family)